MMILPTPYDIDSLYTIKRIQPQIVYLRIQNNNQYKCSPLLLFVLRQYQQIYISKGNELKAGEREEKIKRTIL